MTASKRGKTTALLMPPESNPSQHPLPELGGSEKLWVGRFQAMASDCDILMEGLDRSQAAHLLFIAASETWRIEYKFSRYREDNIMSEINHSHGKTIRVDDETAALLNFADQCFQLSDGLFDISSGVLRRIWHFDGSDAIPAERQIQAIMRHVGWQKLKWEAPMLTLNSGMELDFGGIGKEYAVDKTVLALRAESANYKPCAFVVNFGGDLACSGPRLNGKAWVIGVESNDHDSAAVATVSLSQGAVATSGDSRRYLMKDGVRYSHILNPLTGTSVFNAPHAISVAAPSCLQAGMYSTLAMLQGDQAEAFLQAQEVQYWIQR